MKIQTGIPSKSGTYVAYTDDKNPMYPKKKLLMYVDNKWGYPSSDQMYRGVIFGWIGPLPTPSIENLKYKIKKYAITTIMGREFGSYKAGIFDNFDQALDEIAEDGDFIWEIDVDGSKKALAKWSIKRNDWVFKKEK